MSATLPVLTFHRVDDGDKVTCFAPARFERVAARLAAAGYYTLSLKTAVDCLRDGTPFPERTFVITFDDGYESVYRSAFPILRRYHMTATVFLIAGRAGRRDTHDQEHSYQGCALLTWQQVREMQQSGIDFGAHTVTHPDLTVLTDDQVETEMLESRDVIEQATGVAAPWFAYPYGRFDRRCRAIAQRVFDCACSDQLGMLHRTSDPYALERVEMYYLHGRAAGLVSSRLLPLYLSAVGVPRRMRRALPRRRDT